jgi:membrane-bound metal-dependent hydrolase YbcI (DUF457 family)
MFIGHFAPAFIAASHPKAPRLGTLFIAAQLVDIAFFSFVMMGIENMRIVPKITATNPMDLYFMPFTHSLLGSALWGLALATVIAIFSKNRIAAQLSFLVVVSHWFLDVLVHRADMTVLGSAPKMGFGLWNHPLIEMPLELVLTGVALGYYLIRTRRQDGATHAPAWILGSALLLVQLYNWLSPEPTDMDMSLPLSALLAYGLFIWLAYRLDKTRIYKAAIKGAGENA